MNASGCGFERRVIEESKRGRWTCETAEHVFRCPECSEIALVARAFGATEMPRDFEVDLSQAGRIWRRAEMEKQQERAERAVLPVAIGEALACAVGGVALGSFALRSAASSAPTLELVGQRLLTDPLLLMLGATAALLLIGSGLLSFLLFLGFGPAKS